MTRVTAIVAAASIESRAGTEFLRVLTALRAAGVAVRLVEAGAGVGALTGGDPLLEPDGERYVAALAEEGVVAGRGTDVPGAIAEADAVVVLLDPARTGSPPLWVLPTRERPADEDVPAMLQAGQVVLGARFPAS